MPWWITAIVFFCVGATVERFILDRRFIREWNAKRDELVKQMDQSLAERKEKDKPQ